MLIQLVRRARRRYLWNEVLAQTAFALSTAFGSMVLLLLVGTQILSWYWLVLVPLVAFGLGLYRVLRRVPSPYRIAQLLDQRLGVADTLSTACFFAQANS